MKGTCLLEECVAAPPPPHPPGGHGPGGSWSVSFPDWDRVWWPYCVGVASTVRNKQFSHFSKWKTLQQILKTENSVLRPWKISGYSHLKTGKACTGGFWCCSCQLSGREDVSPLSPGNLSPLILCQTDLVGPDAVAHRVTLLECLCVLSPC